MPPFALYQSKTCVISVSNTETSIRFPIADVLWTLAMAINVYLIVFHSYDIESLRRLEWKYVAGITTVTFIPAFVMLFIRTPDKGPMYGGVTVSTCFPHAGTSSALSVRSTRLTHWVHFQTALVCHRPEVGAVQDRHILRSHLVMALFFFPVVRMASNGTCQTDSLPGPVSLSRSACTRS